MAESNARVNLDVGLGRGAQPRERDPGRKFRIALVGDFSGRGSRAGAARPALRPVSIDPGNFEDVMTAMAVELHLAAGGDPMALRFADLDDFHPDHLLATMPLFRSLRAAREEFAKQPAAAAPPPAPAPESSPPARGLSFLEQIAEATPGVAETEPAAAPAQPTGDLFDEAIRSIASRHAVPQADPRQQTIVAQMDSAMAEAMRTVLAHPAFQTLEAAWRSVFFLLQRLDVTESVEICLLDVTRAELVADLASPEFDRTQLWRELVTAAAATPGATPWAVIAGLYTFAPTERDCAVLSRMAKLAAAAGAPFVGAIDPRIMGCASMAATPDPDDWKSLPDASGQSSWRTLRAMPGAQWLGLMMPRFLLRLPYGRKTSPVDSFDFEEMPEPPVHDGYLWGNPSVVAACLLAQAFERSGWDLHPGEVNRATGVALHVYDLDLATPPAECWITERFAERMLDAGVMPLASVKHSDAVQVVRFQSIAEPVAPLAGPWA